MKISNIQLAVALLAALGLTVPALADDTTNTDKTTKTKTTKSCKKGDKSCKKGDKTCKDTDMKDKTK